MTKIEKFMTDNNIKECYKNKTMRTKCATANGLNGDCWGDFSYKPIGQCKQCWEKTYVETCKR